MTHWDSKKPNIAYPFGIIFKVLSKERKSSIDPKFYGIQLSYGRNEGIQFRVEERI